MTTRRAYLKLTGATSTLPLLSGCTSWIPGIDDNDDNDGDSNGGNNDGGDGSTNDGDDDSNDTETNTDTNSGGGDEDHEQEQEQEQKQSQENDTENESAEGNNESEAEGDDQEEEKPARPDENETEVDKEKYDEPAHAVEPKELDESAADISLDVNLGKSGAQFSGTISNACGCKIHSVDVDFGLYDANGDYAGGHTVSVGDLGPDEQKDVDDQVPIYDLQAVPRDAKVLGVTVMGYG